MLGMYDMFGCNQSAINYLAIITQQVRVGLLLGKPIKKSRYEYI